MRINVPQLLVANLFFLSIPLLPVPQATHEVQFKTIGPHPMFSDNCERKNYIIEEQKDWIELWKKAHSRTYRIENSRMVSTAPTPPAVDFRKQMVIAVFQGSRTGSYSIEITRLVRQGNKLTAFVEEKSPGRGCTVMSGLGCPSHMIVTDKSNRDLEFSLKQSTFNCR